eukprot:CAMPEP_0182927108 /NCGR_PEP_ID=MMETSP0105_2-20130417/13216_1 /TAXON_ID=81532 ORGANISM="Acanthoeca-like sp., Strain 10tr" /NCGR_SAMPLE_ID=MMETSP0105_2 /ASSEMBLY_ACC=CAM_ASM_000205 /LENGTH=68 /DNA_ID=CAMNT_0025065035 /DNA_START=52 /DNA_END=258 /DNA_ORIENTATION=+
MDSKRMASVYTKPNHPLKPKIGAEGGDFDEVAQKAAKFSKGADAVSNSTPLPPAKEADAEVLASVAKK